MYFNMSFYRRTQTPEELFRSVSSSSLSGCKTGGLRGRGADFDSCIYIPNSSDGTLRTRYAQVGYLARARARARAREPPESACTTFEYHISGISNVTYKNTHARTHTAPPAATLLPSSRTRLAQTTIISSKGDSLLDI